MEPIFPARFEVRSNRRQIGAYIVFDTYRCDSVFGHELMRQVDAQDQANRLNREVRDGVVVFGVAA